MNFLSGHGPHKRQAGYESRCQIFLLPLCSLDVCATLQVMPAQSKAMAEFCRSIKWNLICGSARLLKLRFLREPDVYGLTADTSYLTCMWSILCLSLKFYLVVTMLVFWVRSWIPFHLRQRCLWLPHSQSMLYSPGFLRLCISKELLKETVATSSFLSLLLILRFLFVSFPLVLSPFLYTSGIKFCIARAKLWNIFVFKPITCISYNWQRVKALGKSLASFYRFNPLCKCSWCRLMLLRPGLIFITIGLFWFSLVLLFTQTQSNLQMLIHS